MWILIVLSLTWDVQGGQMGYNTFGNILFFGLGMYICSSFQIGLFFPLAEWTASGGEKTFVHTPPQYFQGLVCWFNPCRDYSCFSCCIYWLRYSWFAGTLFCYLHLRFRYCCRRISRWHRIGGSRTRNDITSLAKRHW